MPPVTSLLPSGSSPGPARFVGGHKRGPKPPPVYRENVYGQWNDEETAHDACSDDETLVTPKRVCGTHNADLQCIYHGHGRSRGAAGEQAVDVAGLSIDNKGNEDRLIVGIDTSDDQPQYLDTSEDFDDDEERRCGKSADGECECPDTDMDGQALECEQRRKTKHSDKLGREGINPFVEEARMFAHTAEAINEPHTVPGAESRNDAFDLYTEADVHEEAGCTSGNPIAHTAGYETGKRSFGTEKSNTTPDYPRDRSSIEASDQAESSSCTAPIAASSPSVIQQITDRKRLLTVKAHGIFGRRQKIEQRVSSFDNGDTGFEKANDKEQLLNAPARVRMINGGQQDAGRDGESHNHNLRKRASVSLTSSKTRSKRQKKGEHETDVAQKERPSTRSQARKQEQERLIDTSSLRSSIKNKVMLTLVREHGVIKTEQSGEKRPSPKKIRKMGNVALGKEAAVVKKEYQTAGKRGRPAGDKSTARSSKPIMVDRKATKMRRRRRNRTHFGSRKTFAVKPSKVAEKDFTQRGRKMLAIVINDKINKAKFHDHTMIEV